MICDFCGKKENEVKLLIKGDTSHICEHCVNKAHSVVRWHLGKIKKNSVETNFTSD